MAEEATIKPLQDLIGNILKYDIETLVSRDNWGEINFESARQDLERIFSLTGNLSVLPLGHLTDAAVAEIIKVLTEALGVIETLDNFVITTGQPALDRDQIVSEIHGHADSYYSIASQWVPFLAYQQEDVAADIQAINSSMSEAFQIVESGRTTIDEKVLEIDDIVTKTREASAGAGAAVFTKDFNTESSNLKGSAKIWLWVTGGLATITIVFAVGLWWLSEPVDNPWQAAQRFGARVIILVVLFTATLWCGRIYKALMHQSTNNRHRALSLQTFQAFSAAASEDPTRDAVLLEATRTIFTLSASGYIDSPSTQDGTTRIVEMAKFSGSRGETET